MSWRISNICPSNLQHRFEDIPEDTEILNLGEIHLNYGMTFPPLPHHIKEVNIESNIYVDNRKQERLIKPETTKQEMKDLLMILFPNYKGVKFYVSHYLFSPKPTLDDIDDLFD
jgi:hypothetical protein